MNKYKQDIFNKLTLWDHQENFIKKYYDEPTIKKWQLNWTTGTGKRYLISALISNEYLFNQKENILIISGRKVFINEWKRMINVIDESINPILLDRKMFMRYQYNETTPSGIVILNSHLFNFLDFYEFIKQIKWDIVVLDEPLMFDTKLINKIRKIINNKNTKKSIIISQNKIERLNENMKIDSYDIINKFILKTNQIKIINYKRTLDEIKVLNMIEDMAKKIQISEIENIAYSSFFTLNIYLKNILNELQYIRNKMAHKMEIISNDINNIYKILYNYEIFYNDDIKKFIPNNVFELVTSINIMMGMIDEITYDNKLLALSDYIGENYYNNKHIIVWTSYRNTGEYLYNNLLDLNIPVYILKENERDEKRYLDYNDYKKNGGVMVLIGRGLTDTRLDYIDECINYDVKLDSMELRERYSRIANITKETIFSIMSPHNSLEKDLMRLENLTKLTQGS